MTEPTYLERVATIPGANLGPRTAGALPAARTFDMVTEALNSEDIEAVKNELIHSRAHYQALEYALANEQANYDVLTGAFEDEFIPRPETIEEAIQLTLRFVHKVVLEDAYQAAHQTGFFLAMGMNVDEERRTMYPDLDFSDPERELSDSAIAAFIGSADGDISDNR